MVKEGSVVVLGREANVTKVLWDLWPRICHETFFFDCQQGKAYNRLMGSSWMVRDDSWLTKNIGFSS